MQEISVQQLKAKMDAGENFHLIDVRELEEFNEFNMNGKLIPLGEIQMQIADGEFDEIKDDEIIVHCRSGKRSMMAQMMLMEAGCTNVHNLTGGALAWLDAFGHRS